MPHNHQVPENILGVEDQDFRDPSAGDKIRSLDEQLSITQDALNDANAKIVKLEARNQFLEDNNKIKQSAVTFSKWFMILVPAICLIILIASVTKEVGYSWASYSAGIRWDVDVKENAQAALVVAPMLFIATVLGLLLKGVFGQNSDHDGGLGRHIQDYMPK